MLAIEPLADPIRGNPNINGFEAGPNLYKISLFADDVILYLTNPEGLLSSNECIKSYSSPFGYKVNIDKSDILPLPELDFNCVRFILRCHPQALNIWVPVWIATLQIFTKLTLTPCWRRQGGI